MVVHQLRTGATCTPSGYPLLGPVRYSAWNLLDRRSLRSHTRRRRSERAAATTTLGCWGTSSHNPTRGQRRIPSLPARRPPAPYIRRAWTTTTPFRRCTGLRASWCFAASSTRARSTRSAPRCTATLSDSKRRGGSPARPSAATKAAGTLAALTRIARSARRWRSSMASHGCTPP